MKNKIVKSETKRPESVVILEQQIMTLKQQNMKLQNKILAQENKIFKLEQKVLHLKAENEKFHNEGFMQKVVATLKEIEHDKPPIK